MILSSLNALSIKLIVPEASFIGCLFILVNSTLCLSYIAMEVSFVKRSIFKNKGPTALSLSMIKITNINAAVLFEHPSESIRTSSLLDNLRCTLSSSPTYTSLPYFWTWGLLSVLSSLWKNPEFKFNYFICSLSIGLHN